MTVSSVAVVSRPVGLRLAAALAGALVVAAAAQVAIPIPGSPVPFTLQPLAVLIVGGLLGPQFGALSLALYLGMGAAGLPVFTPFGAPGLARLLGPTGGFLLAYPVAAAVVGWAVLRAEKQAVRQAGGQAVGGDAESLTARPPVRLLVVGCLAGMAVIFAGGVAQLAILGAPALALGLVPFIWADLVKVLLAALVLRRLAPTTRALR
jgi:biotin transport system substrate-specific component